MAAVLAFFVVWSLLVQPALRTLATAPAQIDQLNAQLEDMRRVAAETGSLRAVAPVGAAQAAAALRAASDRLGAKARLTLIGDRATLTLTGVDGEALRNWLQEVRSAARGRPIEAQLQRGADGYSGSLIVSLGAGA